MVDSVTGDVVESDEQVKGYAIAKDQYIIIEGNELSNIAIESSRTIDIEKFVPKASIVRPWRSAQPTGSWGRRLGPGALCQRLGPAIPGRRRPVSPRSWPSSPGAQAP